ncbi:MAG TPA: MqnA/MqnD/SBP family protein, partial [Longimicrobium sp.]
MTITTEPATRTLSLGYSPCPNDTFIFHALVEGIVGASGLEFRERLEDVETLNRLAAQGALDVTKVSYGAIPRLVRDYVLLRSGGALGRGCGPLVVAREAFGQ